MRRAIGWIDRDGQSMQQAGLSRQTKAIKTAHPEARVKGRSQDGGESRRLAPLYEAVDLARQRKTASSATTLRALLRHQADKEKRARTRDSS